MDTATHGLLPLSLGDEAEVPSLLYFIEGDNDETPFSREMRAVVYQRAKGANDTRALGTRRDVNAEGFEWINHSMFPVAADDVAKRVRGEAPAVRRAVASWASCAASRRRW